jgi:hypothetical protein
MPGAPTVALVAAFVCLTVGGLPLTLLAAFFPVSGDIAGGFMIVMAVGVIFSPLFLCAVAIGRAGIAILRRDSGEALDHAVAWIGWTHGIVLLLLLFAGYIEWATRSLVWGGAVYLVLVIPGLALALWLYGLRRRHDDWLRMSSNFISLCGRPWYVGTSN